MSELTTADPSNPTQHCTQSVTHSQSVTVTDSQSQSATVSQSVKVSHQSMDSQSVSQSVSQSTASQPASQPDRQTDDFDFLTSRPVQSQPITDSASHADATADAADDDDDLRSLTVTPNLL